MTDVEEAVNHLRLAAPAWEATGVDHRIGVLERWADELKARRQDLVAALAHDTGRIELSEMEVDSVLASVRRGGAWAREVLTPELPRQSTDPGVTITDASTPFGVVGVISPWNFPLQLALIDAVPALLMGCPVLVKPTEVCPAFVAPLRAAIAAVPELASVLTIVEGGPETGQEIVTAVDVVCFTGSVGTGRKVAAAAAEAFVPAFLELGGKDACIVLEGADLDVAAAGVLWGGTANTGQSCMSIERVYVQENVKDAFVEALVERAGRIGLVGVDVGGQIGPFIDPRQAEVVSGQLRDAVANGARVLCGGEVEVHHGRSFLRPTVVVDTDHSMELVVEETFGPVLPVLGFSTDDEAVRMANETRFGLSGAVFGPPARARAVAGQLDAGGVSVNDVLLTGVVPEGEKQAFKESGMGPSRMGPASLRRFRRQRVLLERSNPGHQGWWY